MPRSPKDNLEIRETRRDEILAAAKRVFADKGFASAKISEVAADAGLSHGLVYHYFESKDALFAAIVEQMIHTLETDMKANQPRAVDRIRAVVARQREDLEDPLNPIRLVIQAGLQDSLPANTKTELKNVFMRFAAQQERWITEAQATGDLDDTVPPDQIMKVLLFLLRGMCVRMRGGSSLPLPETESILQLLLPAPRRRKARLPLSPKGSPKVPRKRS